MASRKMRMARASLTHGRHVYAYCNVRTNQILYSLDRTLNNGHLKQLPDVGANFTPPKIRKDIWRPLWTVTLPDSTDGRNQGLDLFERLKRFKMLHETNWELPEKLTRPYGEKEMESFQEDLDKRGGSKKETVYDIIKRKKWKMRVHMVMNQKYNSIADLAAILIEQEDQGEAIVRDKKNAEVEQKNEMVRLAEEYEKGEIEGLRLSIAQMKSEAHELLPQVQNREFKPKVRRAANEKMLGLHKEIKAAGLTVRKMEWSAKIVPMAKEWAKTAAKVKQAEAYGWATLADGAAEKVALLQQQHDDILEKIRKLENGDEKARLTLRLTTEIVPELQKFTFLQEASLNEKDWQLVALEARYKGLYNGQFALPPEREPTTDGGAGFESSEQPTASKGTLESRTDFREYLPDFPPNLHPVAAAKAGGETPKIFAQDGVFRSVMKTMTASVFTVQGVKVKWANVLDAEFAHEWPRAVQHERLGFVRHSAPNVDEEGKYLVSDFKAAQWKSRQPNWRLGEEQEAEARIAGEAEAAASAERSAVVEKIKEKILEEVKLGRRKRYVAMMEESKQESAEAKAAARQAQLPQETHEHEAARAESFAEEEQTRAEQAQDEVGQKSGLKGWFR